MDFKYFIEFDGAGDIKNFYKSESECAGECKEYIVKLIPIKRDEKGKGLVESAKQMVKETRKLDTEINKVARELRRFSL